MKTLRARMSGPKKRGRIRAVTTAAALAVSALSILAVMGIFSGSAAGSPDACPAGSTLEVPTGGSGPAQCVITATGTPVGAVKHVWLIILENKSYDETFTGLNQNSYLWQTLPQQGALLTHYYGTGHFSMDNYISLVSGQAPSYAVQDDCSTTANMTNNNSGIITTGTVGTGTDTDNTSRRERDVHHGADHERFVQRQLRPAARARRRRRCPRQQRLRVPDRTCRRCSTSSTPPASRGRATPRTSAAPSPSDRPPT